MANRSFLELRLGLLGLLLLVFSCQEESPDPTCSPYTPPIYPDQYDFPLRPGMPEWAALQTGEDMYKVTQLPDSVLQEISSEGLLETCLDYPLLYNVFAYTSLQFGFTRVLSRFNGFEELGSRPDASPLLLNRYQEMDVTCFQNMSEVEQGGYTFTFTFVE
ncbi:MAG: hypothetical protein HC880_00715 [Bacteroidia bacterium]|nr:hypothetical protein [Bacteroidia bacterium]